MPLIDNPFCRIAMDLVGPIHPASERGHHYMYIYTVIDFSRRYPGVCLIGCISTVEVSEALVDIYSRMGIPNEILTDEGTQFTSDHMKKVGEITLHKANDYISIQPNMYRYYGEAQWHLKESVKTYAC